MNDPKAVTPIMTVPQMVSDTEQLIQYLRRAYGKQKIILLGHSLG